MFGNSGQHARTYFLIVMEGKDNETLQRWSARIAEAIKKQVGI